MRGIHPPQRQRRCCGGRVGQAPQRRRRPPHATPEGPGHLLHFGPCQMVGNARVVLLGRGPATPREALLTQAQMASVRTIQYQSERL